MCVCVRACVSDKNSDLISCVRFYKSYEVSNNKITTLHRISGYPLHNLINISSEKLIKSTLIQTPINI